MKNRRAWLAPNNITDFRVTETEYLIAGKVLGDPHGVVYYTVEVKE